MDFKEIKKACANAIHERYPDITIYDNEVKQGLKMPCFFISLLEEGELSSFKDIYKIEMPVMLTLVDDDRKKDFVDIITECKGKFLSSFEYLETNEGKIHIKNKTIKYDENEKVLIIQFNVNLRFMRHIEGKKINQVIWKGVELDETE